MTMKLICTSLLLVCAGMLQAADDMPVAARITLEKMNKSVEQLTLVYNRALIDAYTKSIAEFKRLKDKETRNNSIQTADALKVKIERLTQLIADLRSLTQSDANE